MGVWNPSNSLTYPSKNLIFRFHSQCVAQLDAHFSVQVPANMWLVNTETLQLESFLGSQIPHYAILSHTWGDEETSFQEFNQGIGKSKKGYLKVVRCARLAKSEGHKYIWVDTCAIDKTSSAELSEAINSMFRWYSRSQICYVYLADVSGDTSDSWMETSLRESRWFTRGWTLQELIAPSKVHFYNKEWEFISSRELMSDLINNITKIPTVVLVREDEPPLHEFSIAQRMSWASRRKTTRTEDTAYCLMGMFDITMPLLYGEGDKAFTRLQEEITKVSPDQSIFAWREESRGAIRRHRSGLLATSPEVFEHSHNISSLEGISHGESIIINNRGVTATLWIQPAVKMAGSVSYPAFLNCFVDGDPTSRVSVFLRAVTSVEKSRQCAHGPSQYIRLRPDILRTQNLAAIADGRRETLFVQSLSVGNLSGPGLPDFYMFKIYNLTEFGVRTYPDTGWDARNETYIFRREDFSVQNTGRVKVFGLALSHPQSLTDRYLVVIGIMAGANPWCRVLKLDGQSSFEAIWHGYVERSIEGRFDAVRNIQVSVGEEGMSLHWLYTVTVRAVAPSR